MTKMDKNVFFLFHVFTYIFEKKWLFLQKIMRVFFQNEVKNNEILDL